MSIYIHDHRRFKVAAIGLDITHNHKPVVSLKGRVVFNLISAIINESSDYHLKCLITSCEDVLKQREDKLRRSGAEL